MKKLLKKAYLLIPFKKEIFIVIKWIFRPGHSIYKHLYFKGSIKVKIESDKSFRMQHYGYSLENDLFWKGITGRWEKHSMQAWISLSREAKVIFDIGANTGIFSLVSKTLNPKAKVLAFEPVERIFKKLETNVKMNHYDIVCYPKAVSDKSGEAIFYDSSSEHIYTVVINKDLSNDNRYYPVKVPIISIDEVIEEQNLTSVDLLKIDVETHEPEVLTGFSMIQKFKPTLLVEILDDSIGKRVQEVLENHGCNYLYFDIDEGKGFKKTENIRKSSGFNYLVCTETVAKNLQIL